MLVLLAGKDNKVIPLEFEPVEGETPLATIAREHRDLMSDLGFDAEAWEGLVETDEPHWEGNVLIHTWWNPETPFASGSVTAYLFDPSKATTSHTCLVLGGDQEAWVFACDLVDEGMWRLQAASMFRPALVGLDPQTYDVRATDLSQVPTPNPSDVLPPVAVAPGVERYGLRAESLTEKVGELAVYRVANTPITPECQARHDTRIKRLFLRDYSLYAAVLLFWFVMFMGSIPMRGFDLLFLIALVLTLVVFKAWSDPWFDTVSTQKQGRWGRRDWLVTSSLFTALGVGIWGIGILDKVYGDETAQWGVRVLWILIVLGALWVQIGSFRQRSRRKVALEEVQLCQPESGEKA